MEKHAKRAVCLEQIEIEGVRALLIEHSSHYCGYVFVPPMPRYEGIAYFLPKLPKMPKGVEVTYRATKAPWSLEVGCSGLVRPEQGMWIGFDMAEEPFSPEVARQRVEALAKIMKRYIGVVCSPKA